MCKSCANGLESRDLYVQLIRRELLGPGSEIPALPNIGEEELSRYLKNEVLSEKANKRYSIGILFPQDTIRTADDDDAFEKVEAEGSDIEIREDDPIQHETENPPLRFNGREMGEGEYRFEKDDGEDAEADDSLSDIVGMANQNKPSSLGMTFFITRPREKIRCRVAFATYRKPEFRDCHCWLRGDYSVQDVSRRLGVLGLTDVVEYPDGTTGLLLKTAEFAPDAIKKVPFEGTNLDADIKNALWRLWEQLSYGCVREPHEVLMDIDFSKDGSETAQTAKGGDDKGLQHFSVHKIHRKLQNGLWAYTLMVVNEERTSATGKLSDADCMFQTSLSVSVTDNEGLVFASNSGFEDFDRLDSEEKSLVLLYRGHAVYATGLGTSVRWEIQDGKASLVSTDNFPLELVPGMKFDLPPGAESSVLSMRYLSTMDGTDKREKIAALRRFVGEYEKWIVAQEKRTTGLPPHLQSVAGRHLKQCRECHDRMVEGISWLAAEEHQTDWKAFEWTNAAMFMQRIQGDLQKRNDIPDDCDPRNEKVHAYCDLLSSCEAYAQIGPGAKDDMLKFAERDLPRWRPFQLAFILMCIPAMANPGCKERDIVDLIWFPTGGGKTEAYLGLTAFTIFHRRLCHLAESSGTTVMMRYTLRLLANQQFERAAKLICACDLIRGENVDELGSERISIGLWIGGGGTQTPNRTAEAYKVLTSEMRDRAELRKNPETGRKWNDRRHHYRVHPEKNRFQILKCPWCGASLAYGDVPAEWGYRAPDERTFTISCPNTSCQFSSENASTGWGGLPLQVVDEELYKNVPTLLFGTVDKFAQIAWKDQPYNFFGRPFDAQTRRRAPELIIQDELHLISGPLGTIVGLFESAVDFLCSARGVKPKIIASTATIRRADEQCSALYNREYRQFPPPGLDAEDSFYACKDDSRNKARLYVGLMPAGKTKVMMEGRSFAALLQRSQMMPFPSDDMKDKLWTVTAYFNSLKELGKCLTVLNEDVQQYVRRIAASTLSARRYLNNNNIEELTSRVGSSSLAKKLKRLENVRYTADHSGGYPTDVLLATNMISVGIDVPRLNVMLMVGQPKCTSEYIQASSRVGRSDPGVVFVLYDGTKSRDRTHYEQFKAYHQSFYRFVEPTGATPFSVPSLTRALHSVLVACLRGVCGTLTPDGGAHNLDENSQSIKAVEQSVTDFLIARYTKIIERARMNGHSAPGNETDVAHVKEMIYKLLKGWGRRREMATSQNMELHYGKIGSSFEGYGWNTVQQQLWLLRQYGSYTWSAADANKHDPREGAWDTLIAMRNVDAQVKGCLYDED